ncbi:MAG: hypothetical protein ABSA90_04245 [Xanthobacteraceae bacterium]|jgi:hypothetical protein
MQLFGKKPPLDEIEAEIAAIKRRRDRVAAKVEAAQTELDAATAAHLKLHTEADADDLKAEAAAQRRVEAAHSTHKGLSAALAKLETQFAEAERRVAAEREAIARRASADEIERQAKAAEDVIEPAISAFKKLAKIYGKLGDVSFDCASIGRYAEAAASEIELAAAFTLRDVHGLAAGIASGNRPIPQRQTEQQAPRKVAPAPVKERVFAMRPIAWKNGDGSLHKQAPYFDVDLPPALARRALDLGAAIPLADPRRKKLHGTRSKYEPDLVNCVRLDGDVEAASSEEAPPAAPLHSAFEPLDRGKPYLVKTEGPKS